MNILNAGRFGFSSGFINGGRGNVDRSDQRAGTVFRQGDGLCADAATGFQHRTARRISGVDMQQFYQSGGLILKSYVLYRIITVNV